MYIGNTFGKVFNIPRASGVDGVGSWPDYLELKVWYITSTCWCFWDFLKLNSSCWNFEQSGTNRVWIQAKANIVKLQSKGSRFFYTSKRRIFSSVEFSYSWNDDQTEWWTLQFVVFVAITLWLMYWTEHHVRNRALMHKKCLQSHGQWICRWKSLGNVNKLTSCDNLAKKTLGTEIHVKLGWQHFELRFFENKKVRATEFTVVFCR